jgi:hypothetical protein
MYKNWLMKSGVCGIIVLLIGTTLVSSTTTDIPHSTRAMSISGTIYGLPLDGTGPVAVEGAQLFLIGGKLINGITFAFEKSSPTDENGFYSFSDIPIGIFLIVVRKPGEYLGSFRFVRLTSSLPVKHNQDISMIRLGGNGNSSTIDYAQTVNTPRINPILIHQISIYFFSKQNK